MKQRWVVKKNFGYAIETHKRGKFVPSSSAGSYPAYWAVFVGLKKTNFLHQSLPERKLRALFFLVKFNSTCIPDFLADGNSEIFRFTQQLVRFHVTDLGYMYPEGIRCVSVRDECLPAYHEGVRKRIVRTNGVIVLSPPKQRPREFPVGSRFFG